MTLSELKAAIEEIENEVEGDVLEAQVDIKDQCETIVSARRLVEDYEKDDNPEYPAWVFLIDTVVTHYGTCQYLAPDQKHLRSQFLDLHHNGPNVFHECLRRFVKLETQDLLRQQMDEAKNHLITSVSIQLTGMLSDIVREFAMPSFKTSDDVIQHIIDEANVFQGAPSRTKKVQSRWQQALRIADYVKQHSGINLASYIDVVHNLKFKYNKASSTQSTTQCEFISTMEKFQRAQSALHSEITHIERTREAAVQKLALLIRNDFREVQTGRYMKRWSALTKAQQEERIRSFALYQCRQRGISEAGMPEQLANDVLARIAKKLIKPSHIKWVIREGIVHEIVGLLWENEKYIFEQDTKKKTTPRAKKEVKETVKKTIVAKKVVLTNSEFARLNRLTLHLLIKLPSGTGRSTESVAHQVATLFCKDPFKHQVAHSYVQSILEPMIGHCVTGV